MNLDFTPTGWTRVVAGTILITLVCVGISVFVDSFNFVNLTDEAIKRSVIVDILLPVCLAGPLLFLLLRKVQQLAISHRELTIVASTDSLTTVLNRGAFTLLVESYLARAEEHVTLRAGSLLVIDADHFKAINDTFGHQQGDEALKVISRTIKGCLGPADLVGRVGGEEFGVFLPGAAMTEASDVAERIRSEIGHAEFPAGTDTHLLSVSVGGVAFQRTASYDDLFSIADRNLYLAKANGRDQVSIAIG
jgi:diguanylate cyclase